MSHRARLILIVLLGVSVHAPALFWGFFADDHGHQLVLAGEVDHEPMKPWNLYDFGTAPKPGDEVFESGSYAWWTSDDWKVRFLRPVASLSLMLDHAIWGGWAPGYTLSSLALFAVFLLGVHALYRALGVASGVALLATLFVAVEDGSIFPVCWTANRNSLVEGLMLVGAMLAVARPARLGAGALLLAFGAAALTALSKESGVVAFPLVALIVAWRARRGDAVGAGVVGWSIGAAVVLAAAYLAMLFGLGYGADCMFYPTPWGEPGVVARRAALLFATAPLAMSGPIIPDLLAFHATAASIFLPFAVVITAALAFGALRLVMRAPETIPLIAIVALGILPQAGAPTSERLLFVPMIGFAPLLATWIHAWRPLGGGKRKLATIAWISAGAFTAVFTTFRTAMFTMISSSVRTLIVEAEVGDPDDAGPTGYREAFLLGLPTEFAGLVPLTTWRFETGDDAVRFWPVQSGRRALTWTRIDERTFDVTTEEHPFGTGPIERVFLSSAPWVDAGHVWRTALFEVEALEPSPVRAVRFTLPASLDDPSYFFLEYLDGSMRRRRPPAIGETVTLEAVEPLVPMFP